MGRRGSDSIANRCLLNSLFADSNLSSRFKKKHLEDIEAVRIPPDQIELNPPDADLMLDLFNRSVLEAPKNPALGAEFETLILDGRAILLQFAQRRPPERVLPELSKVLLALGRLRAADDDAPAAARTLLLAIKTSPANARPYFEMGRLLSRSTGDRLLSLYYLCKADELAPGDPETLLARALGRLLIRDITGGFADLARVIAAAAQPGETLLRFVRTLNDEGLLKIALILIHHNRDCERVSIPSSIPEIEELLGPDPAYIHHYAFRGGDFEYEEAIREVARLLLEGAFADAEAALARVENGPGAGNPEIEAYRGLVSEGLKNSSAALRAYEIYLTGSPASPIAAIIRGRYVELASRLLDARVELLAVPARQSYLILDKKNLWDAIVAIDDDRLIEERLFVPAGFHELRITFLGEIRMLTGFFAEGRAYRLTLEGDEARFDGHLTETLAYTLDRESDRESLTHAAISDRFRGTSLDLDDEDRREFRRVGKHPGRRRSDLEAPPPAASAGAAS